MVRTAASILNRALKKTQAYAGEPNPITHVVLKHLDAGHLHKAASIIFETPGPFPFHLYARLFQVCSSNFAAVEARMVESHLVTHYPVPPTFLLNRAIEAYGKCGCVEDAKELFEEMPKRDGGSWNAMITTYARGQCFEKALCLFEAMHKSGVPGNEITFASVLGSCAAVLELFLARQIHGLIVKHGLCGNVVLASSLVDIYGKCWDINDARRVFDEIQSPNSISWNIIIRRYLETGNDKDAVFMFFKLIGTNVLPLKFTFSTALMACSSINGLDEGVQIHGVVIKMGYEEVEVIFTSLISMYVKCGDLKNACRIFDRPGSKNLFTRTAIMSGYAQSGRTGEARQLFDDMPEQSVISWNTMLAGYTRSCHWEEALDFIFEMRKTTKDIDPVTLRLILNVSSGLSDVQLGKQVHGFIYRHNFFADVFIGNALLDMYGKCRNLKSARLWFYQMRHYSDVVSWNALLTSHVHHGLSEEAMSIFSEMRWEITPTNFALGTALAACANIFGLEQGKQIHGFMIRNGYEMDDVVRSVLVDMYSKCHCLDYALKVFKETPLRDVILWNSMVLGCCHHRKGKEALELFEMMDMEGVKPDHITFQGVFRACICEGLVDLGRKYFDSMSENYYIIPRLEHYEYMIKLYGYHGFMDELENFVKNTPFDLTPQMLVSVFDYCRKHNHMRLGKWASEKLNELNPATPFQFKL